MRMSVETEPLKDTDKSSSSGCVFVLSTSTHCRITKDPDSNLTRVTIGDDSVAKKTYLVTIRPSNFTEPVVGEALGPDSIAGPTVNSTDWPPPSIKLHKCKKCDFTCQKKDEYLSHIKMKHKQWKGYSGPKHEYQCDRCEFSTAKSHYLRKHVIRLHLTDDASKPYQCPLCNFRCNMEGYLNRHLVRKHEDYKPHECSECNFKYCTQQELKQHRKKQHDSSLVRSCQHCDFICGSRNMLLRHMAKDHEKVSANVQLTKDGGGGPTFTCYFCNTTMNNKYNLIKHIKMKHTQEDLIGCDHCKFKTWGRSVLEDHIRCVHLKIKPYVCKICDYRTNKQHRLNQHKRYVHLKVRPYKCDHCSFRASVSCHLRRHVAAVHLGYKPNMCPLCPYRTLQKTNLTMHMNRVHSVPLENKSRSDQ